MSRPIVWNGTESEAHALLQALHEHCECQIKHGRRVSTCACHSMLLHDQRAIDGLLFMRHIAARLLAEEFHVAVQACDAVERQPTSVLRHLSGKQG